MIRNLITLLVPFVAPFVLYAVWNFVVQRHEEEGHPLRDPLSLKEIPWIWLSVAGSALAALVLAASALFWSIDPEAQYKPPHFEDGRRVPGRFAN